MVSSRLVRNVLTACVREDGSVSGSNGYAVLLYDARNPAFQAGGKGLAAFDATRSALNSPDRLRKCSGQTVTALLAEAPAMKWLADALSMKYGFVSS